MNKRNSPYLIVLISFIATVLILSTLLLSGDTQPRKVSNGTSVFDLVDLPNFGVISILIIVLLFVVCFLLLREIFAWYWKINKAIGLLEKIEENTRHNELEGEEKNK